MSEKSLVKSADKTQQVNASVSATQDRSWSSYSSYLKKAVANVESQLDRVLDSSSSEVHSVKEKTGVDSKSETISAGRLSMQDRLAKAVGRNGAVNEETKENIAGTESGDELSIGRRSVENSDKEGRKSLEQTEKSEKLASNDSKERNLHINDDEVEPDPNLDGIIGVLEEILKKNGEKTEEIIEKNTSGAGNESSEGMSNMESPESSSDSAVLPQLSTLLSLLKQQKTCMDQKNFNTCEKINSLELKLKYLAKLETDRSARAKNQSTGIDRTLADKDEQIAALMAEGQELSTKELKHMNMIKKLRAKERDYENSIQSYIKQASKSEHELTSLRDKIKQLSQFEKESKRIDKELAKKNSEIAGLQKEKSTLETSLKESQQKISDLQTMQNEEKTAARDEALIKATSTIDKLSIELENAENEKKLIEKLHQRELTQLQEQLDDEIKTRSLTEIQLREELSNLEAKTEYYRSMSENSTTKLDETTSNHDSKLLRQIETLHSQHAAATENWHGIESNLMSRINSLESELEDVKLQYSDLRKRLKSNTEGMRLRNEENEKLLEEMKVLERRLKDMKQESSRKDETIRKCASLETKLKNRISELEETVDKLEKQIDQLKTENMESTVSTPQGTVNSFFNEMPSSMNDMSFDSQSHGLSVSNTPMSSASLTDLRDDDRRRSSSAFHIVRSPSFINSTETIPENEPEDSLLDRSASGLFPQRDSASRLEASSVQTRAGGASLQLVSKMNFTIRRLEQESSSYKHDLEKMIRIKDEAYSEVARLMGEVEDMEKLKNESEELKERVEILEKREKTALEMLGEKSEQVNELRDDVKDLKDMYRQQIEQLANELEKRKN